MEKSLPTVYLCMIFLPSTLRLVTMGLVTIS